MYIEDMLKRKGLASYLNLKCTNCPFIYSGYVRSVYGMRRIGVGHKGLQRFCGIMNIPPPPPQLLLKTIINKPINLEKQ